MPGLSDVTTGLKEGTGLQFQTQIGTAGLNVTLGGSTPSGSLLWNAAQLLWSSAALLWGGPTIPDLAILASDSSVILASDGSYIVTAS